jgi:hypothetical protein
MVKTSGFVLSLKFKDETLFQFLRLKLSLKFSI